MRRDYCCSRQRFCSNVDVLVRRVSVVFSCENLCLSRRHNEQGICAIMRSMPYLKPLMSGAELAFFNRYLADCKGHYFEFGAGGSTCYAALYRQIQPISSVESSHEWIGKVSDDPLIKDLLTQSIIRFIHIDINGDVNNFGYPKDESKKESWPLYSRSICESKTTPPKLMLIDGRFRVACALHSLSIIDSETVVLVHDYRDRKHYHCLLQFYVIIDQCETFVK